MTSLQVELVLALLLDHTQVRPQRCLGDRLGIVVIVLLPLHEGFGTREVNIGGTAVNTIAASRRSAAVPEATAKSECYDRVMKAMHWVTLFLVAAAYAVVWASAAAATKQQSALFVQIHRSLGMT